MRYRNAAEPVLKALRDIGYEAETIGELPSKGRYTDAIPTLMQWLPEIDMST